MKTERISWDDYFSKIVSVTSERSPCERLKVGCLLVNDNRIISQGYNGFLPRCPHKSIVRDNHEQATLHAEQNAIIDCAKRGVTCKGSIAYITHYPCIICCRLLLASEIKEIKYLNDYKNDDLVEHFCKECNVPISKLKEEEKNNDIINEDDKIDEFNQERLTNANLTNISPIPLTKSSGAVLSLSSHFPIMLLMFSLYLFSTYSSTL
jgi:dCMP deaminase